MCQGWQLGDGVCGEDGVGWWGVCAFVRVVRWDCVAGLLGDCGVGDCGLWWSGSVGAAVLGAAAAGGGVAGLPL